MGWEQITHCEIEKKRHQESHMSRSQVTLEVMQAIANSFFRNIQFTGEVSTNKEPIPVLDTQMWVGVPAPNDQRLPEHKEEEGEAKQSHQSHTVIYSFYKKPMASKFGMLSRSALPESTKVATASAEFKRRLKNSSMLLEKEKIEETLIEYSDELKGMGYSNQWVENALTACFNGYKKILESNGPRNRPGASSEMSRRAKKLAGSKTWFQVQNSEEEANSQQPTATPRSAKRSKAHQ